MSIRGMVIDTVEERQQKLNAMMVDRNGKRLVVGDIVEIKHSFKNTKFTKMGVVLGAKQDQYDDFYIKVSDPLKQKGYVAKYPGNIRKANRNKMILFKLENS
jgi:hypothetical protein